jgi:uncharacterized protein (TIGR03435 family)
MSRLSLSVAAITALAAPVAIGLVNARSARAQSTAAVVPAFEVASVKLMDDGTGARNSRNIYGPQGIDFGCSLAFIIGEAYNFPVGRIIGPQSLTKEALWGSLSRGYVIAAKAAQPVSKDQLRLMLQSLLADRFQLAMHRESRTSPVYKLVVATGGPKLEESQSGGSFSMSASDNGFVFRNAESIRISSFLSGRVNRIVVDQTGLKGFYDFTLKMPEDLRLTSPGVKTQGVSVDSPPAGAFADALKQLGLQLVAGTLPVDYLVVDHVEQPSGNL